MKDKAQRIIQQLDTSSDKAAGAAIAKLIKIGRHAVPDLMKAAKNKDQPRIRKWSLQALGAIGDKRSALLLSRLSVKTLWQCACVPLRVCRK